MPPEEPGEPVSPRHPRPGQGRPAQDFSQGAAGAADAPTEPSGEGTQVQSAQAQDAGEQAQAPVSPGPAGSGDYEVRQGECLNSIAADTGHFWQTIWNDAGNAEVRSRRDNPDLLLPGDRLVIPPVRPKEESGSTEACHVFRRRGEPCRLRMRVLREDGEPWAGAQYRLIIDEQTIHEGVLDGDGRLDVGISGKARSARLIVGEPEGPHGQEEYPVMLGAVDPISETSGVQARLNNLGFACGEADGRWSDETASALAAFQEQQGLDATGRLDDATRARLLEVHGS